jgi:hypothetical protein
VLNFIFEPLFVHAPDIIILEISSRYIHSLIKYVDIVNAELIESALKQTIMCSCFNDFLWLSKYKKCCVHLIFIDCFIWLMFILKKNIDSNSSLQKEVYDLRLMSTFHHS